MITLNTAKKQYDTATFKLKANAVYAKDLIKTVPSYEMDLTFVDKDVPTVAAAVADGNQSVIVDFSEALQVNAWLPAAGNKIKIDGQNISSLGFTAPAKAEKTTTGYAHSVQLDFATPLKAGEHTLTVLKNDGTNLVDAAGFGLEEQTVKFTVDKVENAPQVISVEGENNGTVYVTFDRSMDAAATAVAANYTISAIATSASMKPGSGGKVVKLAFASVPKGANVLVIKKNTVQDTFGNKLDAKNDTRISFMATEDTVKPTIVNVAAITNKKVRVKFSEDVNPTYATKASNYKVKDASQVPVTDFTVNGTTEGDTFEINFAEALTGNSYSLAVKNVVDLAATPNTMDPYTTSFNGIDDVSPEVLAHGIIKSDARKVAVLFNEPMDASTITNAANYQYEGGDGEVRNLPSGTILVAGTNNESVEITFPSSYAVLGAGATQYQVKKLNVSNVKDVAQNVLKNVSTGLQTIEASSAAEGAVYVDGTFVATAVEGKVTVEFELDKMITSLNKADFLIGKGTANTANADNFEADSAFMSGNKVVLEFTDNAKIKKIKALGTELYLVTTAGPTSSDAYGITVKPISVADKIAVYDDQIAPELVKIEAADATTIKVQFSEAINKTVLGLYQDDFTIESQGELIAITAVGSSKAPGSDATDHDTVELTLKRALSGNTVVKVSATVDIEDLSADKAGTSNPYVPTADDKNGNNGAVADIFEPTATAEVNKTADQWGKTVGDTIVITFSEPIKPSTLGIAGITKNGDTSTADNLKPINTEILSDAKIGAFANPLTGGDAVEAKVELDNTGKIVTITVTKENAAVTVTPNGAFTKGTNVEDLQGNK